MHCFSIYKGKVKDAVKSTRGRSEATGRQWGLRDKEDFSREFQSILWLMCTEGVVRGLLEGKWLRAGGAPACGPRLEKTK